MIIIVQHEHDMIKLVIRNYDLNTLLQLNYAMIIQNYQNNHICTLIIAINSYIL